jgi:hypothetical protein
MIAAPIPTDRATFDGAIDTLFAEHATLRHLAEAATKRPDFSADTAMSLADAMNAHESTEARLFALPFLTRPPKSVTVTAARARQRCLDYTAGNFHQQDTVAAASRFVDALLSHLDAEEAWLKREKQQHHERLLKAI